MSKSLVSRIAGRLNRDWQKLIHLFLKYPLCCVCGARVPQNYVDVLWPALIESWELNPEEVRNINDREGRFCSACRNTKRCQQLASVIRDMVTQLTGAQGNTLLEVISDNRSHQLRIAEINEVGRLHKFLSGHPQLFY